MLFLSFRHFQIYFFGVLPPRSLPYENGLHFLAATLMQHSITESGDFKRRKWKTDDHDDLAEYTKPYTSCAEAGCDREARDNNRNTPIFTFVAKVNDYDEMDPDYPPDPKDIRKMFEEHDVHVVNNAGDTLLYIVVGREEERYHQEGGIMLFEMLVEMGLDSKRDSQSPPVDVATTCGNEKILALFARDE